MDGKCNFHGKKKIPRYPNHYYNTNMFSHLFLAMNKEKKEEEL